MRVGLLQITSGDDPQTNLTATLAAVDRAVSDGADLVLTPEVTNCVSASRTHQREVLQTQDQDITLAALQEAASRHGVWMSIGSLALKQEDPDARFVNRSFLIDPAGKIAAWYDKIHMFDVQVSESETYRESAGYQPGDRAVCAFTPLGTFGLSVCYDLRFPGLFRTLAQSGAEVLLVPSAFSPVTGAAHWHSLLRARAIETGCFVLAAAQCGTHPTSRGKQRATYGHSLVVDPWGKVLADAGKDPGVVTVDLNLDLVTQARGKIGSLEHDRPYAAPTRHTR